MGGANPRRPRRLRRGHTPDPLAALAELERNIAPACADLTTAPERIHNVPRELALLDQPPERIDGERDAWEARRSDALQQRRAQQGPPPDQTYRHGRHRTAGRSGHGVGR